MELARRARVLIAALAAAALGSCGDDLFHPASMPLVTDHGGHHLARVNLVTMTYPNDAIASTGIAFDDFVVRSQWLRAVGDEYDVRGGAHLGSYVVAHNAPATITTSEVLADLRATVPGVGELVDGELPLYVLYLPQSTTLVDDNFGPLCMGYAAFHRNDGVPYAMIPDCGDGVDARTILASHEIIEAATDPFFDAFYADGADDDGWHYVVDNEVGDLCEFLAMPVHEGGFALQRSWSQGAAAGARPDPCVPVPDGDTWVDVDPYVTYMTLPAGTKETVALRGWASQPGAQWTMQLVINGASDFTPIASIDHPLMTDGGEATLTIEVPGGTASGLHAHVHVWSQAAMAPVEVVVP